MPHRSGGGGGGGGGGPKTYQVSPLGSGSHTSGTYLTPKFCAHILIHILYGLCVKSHS